MDYNQDPKEVITCPNCGNYKLIVEDKTIVCPICEIAICRFDGFPSFPKEE